MVLRRPPDAGPSVAAGRLSDDVVQCWVRAGALAFPLTDREVGERRTMPDE